MDNNQKKGRDAFWARSIPQELKEHPYWTVWTRKGSKKEPLARVNDPNSFVSFSEAVELFDKGGYSGIGILLLGISAIDIDHCITSEREIEGDAPWCLDNVPTYAEVSPSGTGIHMYLKTDSGSLSGLGDGYYMKNTANGLECYIGGETARYMTVTGKQILGTPGTLLAGEKAARDLLSFMEKFMKKPQKAAAQRPAPQRPADFEPLSDSEIIERASSAKNGRVFDSLWSGSDSIYKSRSEADIALCGILAFWSGGNAATVDRLFRQSGLMREKWDEARGSSAYGQDTASKAVKNCLSFYKGKRRESQPISEKISSAKEQAAEAKTGQPRSKGKEKER